MRWSWVGVRVVVQFDYCVLLFVLVVSLMRRWTLSSLFVSFFFCKQKTAYEMRISDWSSDVCSSDLGRHIQSRQGEQLPRAGSGDIPQAHALPVELRLFSVPRRLVTYRRHSQDRAVEAAAGPVGHGVLRCFHQGHCVDGDHDRTFKSLSGMHGVEGDSLCLGIGTTIDGFRFVGPGSGHQIGRAHV